MSDFHDVAASAAGAGALGLLGRALHWVRRDSRPIGWSLLWEVPVAIGMGIIGKGIGDYFGLNDFPEYAVTIGTAYIGPRLIDWCLEIAEQRIGKKPPAP
jgi:hypothetical protein